MRAFRLPPAVRETGMRNAEGLSAKLTEGVTTPSVCLSADTSLKEGGLLSDARQRATEGVTTPSVCLPADTSLEEGGLLSDAQQRATEGVPLHNTAAAIVYPHVNTTSSAAQTDSPTACAARLFRLCACRIGSVASA